MDLPIYNLLGQKVATRVEKKQKVDRYNLQWDAYQMNEYSHYQKWYYIGTEKSNHM